MRKSFTPLFNVCIASVVHVLLVVTYKNKYVGHGGMITGALIRKRVLSMTSSQGTTHKKLK